MINLTSLTYEQMSMSESFVGFDFENVWTISVYNSYPNLNAFPENIIYSPFNIQGYIASSSGQPLQNIIVSFSAQLGQYSTSYDGLYATAQTTESYTGIAVPISANYIFTPESRSYSNITSSLLNENFVATHFNTASSYIISGSTIVSGTSDPISNVTLSLNPGNILLYSDANGQYSYSVAHGFNGQITASHTYYNFQPGYYSYTNVTSSQLNKIYSGSLITYAISGSVLSSSGDPIENITMSNNIDSNYLYTNALGQYSGSFTQSFTFTITPISSSYAFNPGSRTYTNLNTTQSNQNYNAIQLIPVGAGLGTYYDSRIAYNDNTKVWTNISTKGQDAITYNTAYTIDGDLAFGLQEFGQASASFVGTQVSSAFAIEMWIAPNTGSNQRTILSTVYNDYPYLLVYITSSKLVVDYKYNASQTQSTRISSYGINELKFNHVVIFVSSSNLISWANGQYYESASITESSWNGAIIGINTYNSESYYSGFVNVFKVWNATDVDISAINNYYRNKNYWNDLSEIDMPSGTPTTEFASTMTSSLNLVVGKILNKFDIVPVTSSLITKLGQINPVSNIYTVTSSVESTFGEILPEFNLNLINKVYLSTGSSTVPDIININQYVQLTIS